ncbi:BZ3500_MvSof-1268-A1-R1_Chr3-1g05483 [Microbotryum saponariae]|uniref:BZ3500_MvSof-1268-A1-R1_Chr3-1g05483 protein n=1 Tax=Microbotryum saponariae TaxID=289078 RepID=A0A2X0LCH3_9BASI|nr:BZ3500_MvSof-1268-A1-R1_Chr3-1g05483 [Microbotryum saponariae]SDA04674.1 BZ3501_MvSof-1269-A2-R1_Chr3-1g05154 [Microbotryum saponariae]
MNPDQEPLKSALAGSSSEVRKEVLSTDTGATTSPSASAPATGVTVSKTKSNGNAAMDAKLQVVDENQNFTDHLNSHMADWELADKGFAYDVVAVFGSQSTGKSTLLNRLFGTKFDVMNESERRQTTKGIWMSKGQDMPVLVMDVEGTDGRERGEDQDFERKSALFSMAVTEVLIVNIWEHQVGLYQGANMGLLKTVFEVNLGLFLAAKEKGKTAGASQDKTLLLFVIRDHIGATPLENLRNTLTADLNRLWDGLSKPEGLESSQITHFFDLAFVTLPHKLLQPEVFEAEVKNLRKRFVDPSHPDYVFHPKYHKRIPADGVSQYMSTIWDAVVTNKDLDLPTQQELLAQFRCDEIANGAFVVFVDASKVFVSSAPGTLVPGLGKGMQTVRSVALESFDTAASRYHAGVYGRKRAELLDKLNTALLPFVQAHLKNLHKIVLKDFRKKVQERLKVEGYDFAKVVEGTTKEAENDFEKGSKEVLLEETEWSATETEMQLKEDMVAIADLLRAEETKKMIANIERKFKSQISETVEMSLNKPSPDMWDKVLSAFRKALDKAEGTYTRKATSFNCTPEENETALTLLRQRAWLALRAKIDEQTAESVLLVKLKLVFEERFRYDDEGTPRVWKPEDDIDSIFKRAKDEVLGLIPLYTKISPLDEKNAFVLPSDSTPLNNAGDEEFDFESSLTILRDAQAEALSSRFRREADAYYLEAKRSMVSSISQIPVWMYAVLAVLGWNEFIAVLRSPVYFTMLLLAASAAYVTIHLGMTGPVFALAKGVSNEVAKTVNDQLHNYFVNQTPEAHAHRQHQRQQRVAVPASKVAAQEDAEVFELKSMESTSSGTVAGGHEKSKSE